MDSQNSKKCYIFLADCHGVQSLTSYDPQMTSGLNHTCMANVHRFSVWGLIDLDDELFKVCNRMIENKEGKKIFLKLIKERQYSLPSGQSIFKRLMERIPNDELDPFYG